MGKKKYVVELNAEERVMLESVVRDSRTGRVKLLHSFILLKADEGEQGEHWTDRQIADAYKVVDTTVERIRQRFVEEGLEAALNRKPSQRVYRRKIEGEEEAHLIALCCSKPPEGRNRWTMQLLADKLVALEIVETVSDETVRRTLKKMNLSRG